MGCIVSCCLFNPPNNNISYINSYKYSKFFSQIKSGNDTINIFNILHKESDKIIIYSHGNATDINNIFKYLLEMSFNLKISIISYSYSGYINFEKSPKIDNSLQNLNDVYNHVINILGYSNDNIIFYGCSIGSSITALNVSKLNNFNGKVILETPFSSLLDVISHHTKLPKYLLSKINSINSLDTINNIKNIKCPTLYLIAKNDKIVPIRYSIKLYYEHLLYNNDCKLITVKHSGHNNIYEKLGHIKYYTLLKSFIY